MFQTALTVPYAAGSTRPAWCACSRTAPRRSRSRGRPSRRGPPAVLPLKAAMASPAAVRTTAGASRCAHRAGRRTARSASGSRSSRALARARASDGDAAGRPRRRPGRSPRRRRRRRWRRTSRSGPPARGAAARPRCPASPRRRPRSGAARRSARPRRWRGRRATTNTTGNPAVPESQMPNGSAPTAGSMQTTPRTPSPSPRRSAGSTVATRVPTATTMMAKPIPRSTQTTRIAARPCAPGRSSDGRPSRSSPRVSSRRWSKRPAR